MDIFFMIFLVMQSSHFIIIILIGKKTVKIFFSKSQTTGQAMGSLKIMENGEPYNYCAGNTNNHSGNWTVI